MKSVAESDSPSVVNNALTSLGARPSRRDFLRAGLLATAATAAGSLAGCARKIKPTGTGSRAATPRTIFGCFDVHSFADALHIDAHAVRLIAPVGILERDLWLLRQANGNHGQPPPTVGSAIHVMRNIGAKPWLFNTIRAWHKAGVKVVVSLLWVPFWGDKMTVPRAHSPRGRAWLATVREFTETLGDCLYYVTLDNEPLTAYMSPADWKAPAGRAGPLLEWYRQVADVIHQVRPELPICAPANNVLGQIMTLESGSGKSQPWVRVAADHMKRMCDWANRDSNIASLDLHLYAPSAEALTRYLAFARQYTDKPFLSTEWSQAPALHHWLQQPLSKAFTARWGRQDHWHGHGNVEYALSCMRKPVPLDQWNDFMATAPLSPTFMQDSYHVMCKNRVLLSAYSGYQQYHFKSSSNAKKALNYAGYALTMLYANATVVHRHGRWQPNYQFVDWFKAVAWSQGVLPEPSA